MKTNHSFRGMLLLLSATIILTGCKEDSSIEIDITSKDVSGYGDVITVQVKSSASWTVTSDKSWATPSMIGSTKDETVEIAIAPNSTGKKDVAIVTFKTGESAAKLTINRAAAAVSIYRVGDFYPDNQNPIGIVFEVINPGIHGKIVSLNEKNLSTWGLLTCTYATDMEDGSMNLLTIQNINFTLEKFPAFYWCSSQGIEWYLPAYRELASISEAADNVNVSLQKIPGAALIKGGIYWSSTESGLTPDKAYAISLSNGIFYEKSKDSLYSVRAITVF